MEIMKTILLSLGTLSLVGFVIIAAVIWTHKREENAAKKKADEKRLLERAVWDSGAFSHLQESMVDTFKKCNMFTDRLEAVRELGKDAHKRIDDNRRVMFLIESYYDERITALEDEVHNKRKAKKC